MKISELSTLAKTAVSDSNAYMLVSNTTTKTSAKWLLSNRISGPKQQGHLD